ncbi:MAG: hypothetical protein WBC93_12220, partial [Sulfitobacter sp.]
TSLCATIMFAALVWVGLTGPNDPQGNLLPLTLWTVWWVGIVVATGVFGDLWRWVNPWSGLYDVTMGDTRPPLTLPATFGVWPAVLVFLAFYGFIIADIAPSDPSRLAKIAMGYWAVTCAGMILFGRESWQSQFECLSVFFTLIARLSALNLRPRFRFGTPGWSGLNRDDHSLGHAVFCLVMLGSGSFDGLHETFWWLAQIGINPLEFPGRSAVIVPSTLGLIVANIALVVIYACAVWVGLVLVNHVQDAPVIRFKTAFIGFSLTLIPIAFGYHIAHYLTSFLVQIQYWVCALSDPFAQGANYLGLNRCQVTTGFLNTQSTVRVIWLSQAGAVVSAHILSVLMAHHVAANLFPTERMAVRAQIGIGALMIIYTIFGLWLLASPRGM